MEVQEERVYVSKNVWTFLSGAAQLKKWCTARVIYNESTRIWFYSRQIFGVWFGAKCEWGEERKIHTVEKEEGQRERVLDSQTQSDAFHSSFFNLRRNPNLLHSFPAIRCALDFFSHIPVYSLSNSYNTRITHALYTQLH